MSGLLRANAYAWLQLASEPRPRRGKRNANLKRKSTRISWRQAAYLVSVEVMIPIYGGIEMLAVVAKVHENGYRDDLDSSTR
jgi:hypothetical protein